MLLFQLSSTGKLMKIGLRLSPKMVVEMKIIIEMMEIGDYHSHKMIKNGPPSENRLLIIVDFNFKRTDFQPHKIRSKSGEYKSPNTFSGATMSGEKECYRGILLRPLY